jgi:hypothetical protein
MPFNRTTSRVAIGLFAFLMASPTFGQGPLGMQLFAPADLSTYGGAPPPKEGYFFQFDGLYWSVQAPKVALIGATDFRNVASAVSEVVEGPNDQHPEPEIFAETSTEDTSALMNNFSAGQRWEFGRVEDNQGWIVSIFRLGPNEQEYSSTHANVLLNDDIDPNTGHGLLYGRIGSGAVVVGGVSLGVLDINYDLPVVFDSITVRNNIDLWGVEASYLRRSMTFHDGGNLEVFLGARYLEFNEDFSVTATGGVLDVCHWDTGANNHIVGPQIGGRYFKQQGRWILSTEGRFMAGFNRQNIFQEGVFSYTGSANTLQKPAAWLGAQYSHRAVIDEFSPLIELRVELRYVITRAISFHAGWTGFWTDNIARPSNMIDYRVPDMGINPTNNRQDVLVNGLTIGFDINR